MKKRKMPTKAELLQLQKLYKTDEKIGERLGGVAPYLVAYWRRKKNIPKYSLPKFSETEIRNLWERYGDDEKAGLELGISKAAFYNWRRRYGLREKPAFLKLEQLELNFPGLALPSHASSLYGKRSVVQKILARLVDSERVEVGDEIAVEPDLTLAMVNAAEVIEEFSTRSDLVFNSGKVILALGNSAPDIVNGAERDLIVREFARRQNIKAFFDNREGGCQQVAVEKGFILPGRLMVGNGGGAGAFGCMSALAEGTDPVSLAEVWAGEKYKLTVPDSARIVLNGRRSRGVGATDIALHLADQLKAENVNDNMLEYGGAVVSQMSIGERLALSSLARATGARGAICTYDATTRRFLTGRAVTRYQPVVPDKDALYSELYQINIDQVGPQIAPLGKLAEAKPVASLQDLPVQHIFIGSCTAGRFEDLRVAAEILKGNQVDAGCRVIIVPGSRTVYLEALKKGLIRVFLEAGGLVVHPGVIMNLQGQWGRVAASERCLTTTPFPTRNDSPETYLCSPATAAASALHGAVTDPTRYGR